jgi:predicted MFS family arabinose efflux permease
VFVVLSLRAMEGAAHVGAASLLMAEAAALSRASSDPRIMGAAGAGIMFAVALGSALGGILVRLGFAIPFFAASAIAAATAAAASCRSEGQTVDASDRRPPGDTWRRTLLARPELAAPTLAAFVGRFVIGCLVVTFALFAHRVHALSDSMVGLHFTAVTLPFALASYPVGAALKRVPVGVMLRSGALLLALSVAALGVCPRNALIWLMLTMGIASAMVFTATLSLTTELAPPGHQRAAMGLVNAGSCLGMLLGPAVAGITSAIVGRAYGAEWGYRAVFALAGLAPLAWLVATKRSRALSMAGQLRHHPADSATVAAE